MRAACVRELSIFKHSFTTDDEGKATGLGLSAVYGIVEPSGGYIVTESKRDCGTIFRTYLPLVEEVEERTQGRESATSTHAGSETVLLVEDEGSVRELVRLTLESKGYEVLEAEHGEAGLALAANHCGAIDILITDVVMPGIGGLELAQQMLRSHPGLKILFLSGYSEDAITEGGLEAGTAFLQKPFTLQALSQKVQDVLCS